MRNVLLCIAILIVSICSGSSNTHGSRSTGYKKLHLRIVGSLLEANTAKRANSHFVQNLSNTHIPADGLESNTIVKPREVLGVPTSMLPYYVSFMLDSAAVGLVMPLLPFYLMELGASALQLSLVVSANYVAQMLGVLVMGKVSDLYGRRFVMLACLAASSMSYWCVSHATSLPMVALARVISGSLGGLMPIVQSAVADSTSLVDRPKFLGRVSATFGLGFALGPVLNTLLPGLSVKQKIRAAACLPLLGFIVIFLYAKETKNSITKASHANAEMSQRRTTAPKPASPLTREVILLVLNGFLIMYAFGTETVYAMLLKDAYKYGESTLSILLAVNGLFIGLVQVFLIKPLVHKVGQRGTLLLGNVFMAVGMLGLAVARTQALHFALFSCHIVAYSVAETALVSLISRYSAMQSQGRDMALNQAGQACARVFSPLIAGLLYEHSKHSTLLAVLPVGALPFLVGGLCPLVAAVVPAMLSRHSVDGG